MWHDEFKEGSRRFFSTLSSWASQWENLYKSFDKFWFQHKLNIWELAFNILNLILAGFCWDVLCKVCFGCGFEFVFIFKRSLNANENHQMLMKTTKWGEIVHCDLSTHRLLSVTHRSPWGGEGCLAELKLSMDMKSTQSFRPATEQSRIIGAET